MTTTPEPRLALALVTLRQQLNAVFPGRSTASDGWIADVRHRAGGATYETTQHIENPAGVVCAIDVTHDPAHGVDCHRLMAELDASDDPRIFYLIWNRQIDNSDDSRTPYAGANPHDHHLHISAPPRRPELYDDPRPWRLPMLGWKPADPSPTDLKETDVLGAFTDGKRTAYYNDVGGIRVCSTPEQEYMLTRVLKLRVEAVSAREFDVTASMLGALGH